MKWLVTAILFLCTLKLFGYEVVDSKGMEIYMVKRCRPLTNEAMNIKFLPCSENDPTKEKDYFGLCTNNDENSCERGVENPIFTNSGSGSNWIRLPVKKNLNIEKNGLPAKAGGPQK